MSLPAHPRDENGRFRRGPTRPIEERFWEKVEIRGDDECWPWRGAVHKTNGYGVFRIWPDTEYAHRMAYRLGVGEIPAGRQVLHSCDFRLCCNYRRHHFLGTNDDNMADRVVKGRQARGERNGYARLTTERVMEIRKLASAALTHREIASRFGISRQHVGRIVSGELWRKL